MGSSMSIYQRLVTTCGLAASHCWCHCCCFSGCIWLGNAPMELSFLKRMGNMLAFYVVSESDCFGLSLSHLGQCKCQWEARLSKDTPSLSLPALE